jgi:hypothetical protein
MGEIYEKQEEERIREIAREEIEKYMQEQAKYLSLSLAHDFLEEKDDTSSP